MELESCDFLTIFLKILVFGNHFFVNIRIISNHVFAFLSVEG